MMERILNRHHVGRGANRGGTAATRGLILTPTRELAAQCVSMMSSMAKFTNLRGCLIVGGAKNIASQ
eukprot:6873320-Ditylum_brightwellii.AAC.1